MMDVILKPTDVQKMLRCSKYNAYKLFSQPGFPALQIGKEYYIKESDFNKWFDTYKGKNVKFELL